MTAIDSLFEEHWNKLAPGEPATEKHYEHFLQLQREFPMLPVKHIVAFTLADSLLLTWDAVNNDD